VQKNKSYLWGDEETAWHSGHPIMPKNFIPPTPKNTQQWNYLQADLSHVNEI